MVNENSGRRSTANLALLTASPWAQRQSLYLDRTPFADFSTARNRCLEVHREHGLGPWIAFVDADEVHTPVAARIAARLDRLPADVDYVDGYTLHFFQSVDWYTSIERRMAFFRLRDTTAWIGPVHETLVGNSNKRFALPYLYAHYGYILPVRHAAAKGRLYERLGAPGGSIAEADAERADRTAYFAPLWSLALRYRGHHPPAAGPAIASLRTTYAKEFAETSRIVAANQSLARRAANLIRSGNFEYRWRARALDPRASAFVR